MKSFDVLLKTSWFSSPCEWSDLHVREASNPSKWHPDYSCLQKCICEERLSTENISFGAPSIFQELRVPDVRLSDSVDSRSNLWVSIQIQWKSTEINQKSMKTYESMKTNENWRNSWPQLVYHFYRLHT